MAAHHHLTGDYMLAKNQRWYHENRKQIKPMKGIRWWEKLFAKWLLKL